MSPPDGWLCGDILDIRYWICQSLFLIFCDGNLNRIWQRYEPRRAGRFRL
ncbi:hypothetical protein BRPE64_CCDS05360 [Caballeronia insecticola]|uniref:Uncharacterized protein n=1 Tax=Caballeronia insecticola TaxID=758793 RepID=R4WPW4_9BURK|nr:hypothetical protein BRPE64_CCDS05360 [Caballeronia insecticola]